MEIDMEKTWTKEKIQQLRIRLELQQFQYFNGRPEWTSIEIENLKLFMAYTYFGYPFDENEDIDESNDDLFSYYSDEIKELITDMCNIIKTKIVNECDSNIEIGITITHSVCAKKCDICNNFPDQDIHQWYLIRIKLNNLNVCYIDLHHKRTYKNWQDYIKNNSLPKGILFCSESGYYEESNYLNSYLTPPSRNSEKFFSGLDVFGKAATFSSSIIFAGGLVFPVMAPVLLPASITIGSLSAYDAGRQIYKLTDLMQHNQSLVSKKASKLWFDLGVSALGVITAPMTAAIRSLQLSDSVLMATKIGKSLTILQRSVCITQCSLEMIRLSMITHQGRPTMRDLISLRLDLFIVLGSILSITFLENIYEHLASVVPLSQAWTMIKEIPYCVGQMLFESVSYIRRHSAEFAASAQKFVEENLTVEKMHSAWVTYLGFAETYRGLLSQLCPEDALRHVAYDLVELPAPPRSGRPGAAAWDAELRAALCGPRMRELLHALAVDPADRRATRFCAERVAAEAAAVAAVRDQVAADCARHASARAAAATTVDREFRRQYDVTGWREPDDVDDGDGRVAATWYALYGLRAVEADVPGFWRAYREHQARPENRLLDRLVVDRRDGGGGGGGGGGSSRLRVFETVAPPSGDDLDATACAQFARVFDPENGDGYRDYRHFAAGHVQPGACLLWSGSAFSLNVVCFGVRPPRPGAVPSLHVCFYQSQ